MNESLLFSLISNSLVRETVRGLEFGPTDITPKFEHAKVSKPVAVMVEGEYYIFDNSIKDFTKINITAQDITNYFNNTPRDVAVNYEHNPSGKVKGWLRLTDTGFIGTKETPEGPKTALFASLELFEEAFKDVTSGFFRDVSIELKPRAKEIIGIALTGYPIMKNVQFSNLPPVEEEIPVSEINKEERTVENDEQTRKQVMADLLKEMGISQEELADLPNAIAALKNQQKNLRLEEAKLAVQSWSNATEGKVILSSVGQEAAAHLYAFCKENDTVQFSVNKENLSAAQLLETLIKSIEAVQLFGPVKDEDGNIVSQAETEIKFGNQEDEVDTDRISELAKRTLAALQ